MAHSLGAVEAAPLEAGRVTPVTAEEQRFSGVGRRGGAVFNQNHS